MIIVLVCLRLTQQDEIELFYSSLRFTQLSAGTRATMPQTSRTDGHVLAKIVKDETDFSDAYSIHGESTPTP